MAVMLLFAIINMLPWPSGGTTLTGEWVSRIF